MAAIFHSIIESPIGRLHVSTDTECVTKVEWFKSPKTNSELAPSHLAEQTSKQVEEYFNRAHNDWSLPLVKCGTEFQQKVWHYLQTIPLGETRYYSDVAKALNSSAQAVGNACRANPFVIIVPCHRVISKSGLGGYDGQTSGQNIVIKQWLLDHERR
ncbi:MAG: methylated-DNA--[protein]-cysteine S-methyltransferase [Methylophaga sp.]|nr:methylated-DNA--[protein]-cysteine S-methyltransferase [Methylophaga sp.]